MADDNKTRPARHRWAELRFSIIGGLLARPPERGELRRALAELAAHTWPHPAGGAPLRFGLSTLERWYYKAPGAKDASSVAALRRRARKDRGRQPAISAQLAQHGQHPTWSYKLHADNLAALTRLQPELGTAPSCPTVARLLKTRGLLRQRSRPGGNRPGSIRAHAMHDRREVRSFEVSHVGGLWHLDFHHGSRSVLSPGSVRRRR